MRTERNILIAFILNLIFSFLEILGGIITGSVAIISDAIHDFGDALSIGLSYFFEKKSKKQPDNIYTYGYSRYSVLGGFITSLILLLGSIFVICNAVRRIIYPSLINYEGMIIFALAGVSVNFIAIFVTRGGYSLNQKAINLHMLEDVLGWIVVLIGSIVMKVTNFSFIDPIMSIGVALFILINSIKNLREIINLFLEKIPRGINIEEIKARILEIEEIVDVHHIHVWSMDGTHNYATLHAVTIDDNKNWAETKNKIRGKLRECGVNHVTIEFETDRDKCNERFCILDIDKCACSHCGHHHHHH